MQKPIHIPEKLYFKIGEVAKLLHLEPHVLRFWESEFTQLAPAKSKAQQRLYRRDDVETLILIRELLYEKKFTIEGAKIFLREFKNKRKDAKKEEQYDFGFLQKDPVIERRQSSEAPNGASLKQAAAVIKDIIQEMAEALTD